MEQNHMLPPQPLQAQERSQSPDTTSLPPQTRPQTQTQTQLRPLPSFAPTPDPALTSSLSLSLSPPLSSPSATGSSPQYSFPDIPGTALPPIQHLSQHENTLPSLSSVTGSGLYRDSHPDPSNTAMSSPAPAVSHWPSMNPLTQFYTPSHIQRSPSNSPANTAIGSPGGSRRGNSVSWDDPDVRMAAEALGHLRADFVSSPPNKHAPLPLSPLAGGRSPGTVTPRHGGSTEPILSLLTTAHPSIATTIEGATAAYTTGKNYSPRFKSGAEYVEGFVTPVANTVGSMGRAAGVEGGLRWYLRKAARGRRYKANKDSEAGESHKRRRVGKDAAAPGPALGSLTQAVKEEEAEQDPRLSIGTVETLPAYDDVRSPDYTEMEALVPASAPGEKPLRTRLLMTTSGLSISMSEESLRSLKYCLRWLRWANGHISQVIENLKTSLEQYDAKTSSLEAMEAGQVARERRIIVERIATLKNDVLKTLQDAIQTVSRYAGGALPENARELVRNQLTSLPRRFFLAQKEQESNAGDGTTTDGQQQQPHRDGPVRDGAQRVLVLAMEGLDMITQVGNVLDGTIVSAEEWCEKLGRKRRASQETPSSGADVKRPLFPEAPVSAPAADGGSVDVAMTG